MMKKLMIWIVSVIVLTGCASTVTTYDTNGKMIGSCQAERGFMLGGGASCIGHANQEGRIR